MPLTLKSHAIVDAATAVYIAENGLTNMVGGATVTVVGTMPSSTVNGHAALGAGAADGSYLQMAFGGAVAASTVYSVLIVGQITSSDDFPGNFLTTNANAGAAPVIGTTSSAGRKVVGSSSYITSNNFLGTVPGASWSEGGEQIVIVGRNSANKVGGSLNGATEVFPGYTDGTVSGATIGATDVISFGGSQGGGSAGFAVSMMAFFPGVSPESLNAYIGTDPWGQMLASGDTTAPVLTSPVGTQTGSSTATIGATTDEGNGTMYSVVTVSGTAPSVAQIQAGQDNSGSAAAYSGSQSVSSTGAKTFSATGLAASTAYYAHIQHKDAAGNDSTVVTSAQFTTASGASALAKIIQLLGA